MTRRTGIWMGALLALASPVLAQSGGGFDLSWNTIDGGGTTASTGGSFELAGTIGQPDAGGPASGGTFALAGGLWPGVALAPSPTATSNLTQTATATPTLTGTATQTSGKTPTLTPTITMGPPATTTSTRTQTATPTATTTPAGCTAPTLVGTANINTGTAGASLSVTVGAAGVPAGSTILVGFTTDQTAGPVSCADSAGNAYMVELDLNNSSDLRTVICAAYNAAALVSGNTITVTHPSTTNSRNVSVEMVSGVQGVPLDRKAGATGSSATPSSGLTALTTHAAEVLYGVVGLRGVTLNFTAPGSGFTAIGGVGSSGNVNRATEPEYQIVAATGQYAATATLSTAKNWAAGILTLRCN